MGPVPVEELTDARRFSRAEAAIREDAPTGERPLFHTEGGGIAADVVKVNTRDVATYTDEFEAVTPSQAETSERTRIYDPKTKAFENYLDTFRTESPRSGYRGGSKLVPGTKDRAADARFR